METHVIIMAGGTGRRFWPMSTSDKPKQFIDVFGCGETLLQLTVKRFLHLCTINNIWIVTSCKYLNLVQSQLPNLPISNILCEPVGRNTAPCIAYACWKIKKNHPLANVIVSPSDALILDDFMFSESMTHALDFVEDNKIITIGVKPTRPETGYGYISVNFDNKLSESIYKVRMFKEKPDLTTAMKYLKEGDFYWNAGIFVWNIKFIEKQIRRYLPRLAKIMDIMALDFYTNKEQLTLNRLFPTCENISIDYGVIEQSDAVYTELVKFNWSDLGTWGSLHNYMNKDCNDNSVIGNNVKLIESNKNTIYLPDFLQVVIQGLDGYIIASNKDSLLICKEKDEQHIKDFIQDFN